MRAVIESGDVILKFNDKDIVHSSDLPPLVADLVPGSTASVEVWHKTHAKTLSVKVGEMNTTIAKAESDTSPKGKLGLAVRPLTSEERKRADVANDEGLIVEHVADGPAAQAGIRPGDIILAVNGEKVGSVDQLRSLVDKSGKRLAFHIIRNDMKMFVAIRVG